uniref:Uncharacterized protein n=1 Tax=Anguilla anguilla TaxID=7936 RepID=A0A0E9QPM1_ANGAN
MALLFLHIKIFISSSSTTLYTANIDRGNNRHVHMFITLYSFC